VDARGRFCGTTGEFLKRVVTRRIDLREVEIELRRQIIRVLRAGLAPTHLDTHKHLHVLPGISEIVIRLAQEFGIRNVRCPAEQLSIADLWPGIGDLQADALKQRLAGCAVSQLARRLGSRLTRAGLNHPSHFYGLMHTGFLNEETLGRILRALREGVSELMCHPGYADSVLAKTGTRLLAQREIEARAIMSSRTRALVSSQGIRLLSYAELGDSAKETEFPNGEVKNTTECVKAV
jgi:predicted glycoside hydrolase/deacetylase ChbG (UPF0249 family)